MVRDIAEVIDESLKGMRRITDLVAMGGPTPGLYEHDDAEGWQPEFKAMRGVPEFQRLLARVARP